jgi:hypothetical protein
MLPPTATPSDVPPPASSWCSGCCSCSSAYDRSVSATKNAYSCCTGGVGSSCDRLSKCYRIVRHVPTTRLNRMPVIVAVVGTLGIISIQLSIQSFFDFLLPHARLISALVYVCLAVCAFVIAYELLPQNAADIMLYDFSVAVPLLPPPPPPQSSRPVHAVAAPPPAAAPPVVTTTAVAPPPVQSRQQPLPRPAAVPPDSSRMTWRTAGLPSIQAFVVPVDDS